MSTEQSFLDLALDNIEELVVLPAGEHELTIRTAEVYDNKNTGKKSIKLLLESVEVPNSKDFTHFLSLPSPNDSLKQNTAKRTRIRDFVVAVGLDVANFQIQDLVGRTFWAKLDVETSAEYGDQNVLKTVIVPR